MHPEMPVPLLDGRKSWPRPWPHLEPAQYNHGAPETMVLPGGCTLPPKQYQRIVAFMKAGGVRKCACSSGAVVCHVD
ncbi:hypothetical protein FOCC_FOCC016895 [Frankliniella occidentalis]|nr:hypothetical protein FOCC_FOCC016895 [Frankliniella occidentalis]